MRRGALWLAVLALAVTADLAVARPRLRGVIEGYYGRPWSGEARRTVIRFLGTKGLNTFVYGPKNDDYHRARWREPYPADALADLERSATTARAARVQLVYAVSPVLDVCYSCPGDFDALTAKLAQVASVGVRRFALFFDDGGALVHPDDVERYGGTDPTALARAQADLVNRVRAWLRARRLHPRPLVVPSDYAGTACHPYHTVLDEALARGIPVAWTGASVVAPVVTEAEARARAACLPRHPVVLWDNYPVNDTVLSINLHLGPLTGREAGLARVLRGHLLNPMTQAHASLVPLATAAAYLRDPRRYDPETAWESALADVGSPGFTTLAHQLRSSGLDLDDAHALAAAVDDVAADYPGAAWPEAVAALEDEATTQAAAPDDIAARLGGTPLGDEIAPWVADLAAHASAQLDAARLLRAMKPDLHATGDTAGGGLRVRGRALPPDGAVASALGPGFAAAAQATAARIAAPPVLDLIACLGELLSADIAFCPTFGLNVHGKALYFLLTDPPGLVADRNVHDRMVLFVGAEYTAWLARRIPGADALALEIEGQPVPLAIDGTFDVTVPAPPGGRAVVLASTAAGEMTARVVP